MKKWKITATATVEFEYTVEAETEEEAIELWETGMDEGTMYASSDDADWAEGDAEFRSIRFIPDPNQGVLTLS